MRPDGQRARPGALVHLRFHPFDAAAPQIADGGVRLEPAARLQAQAERLRRGPLGPASHARGGEPVALREERIEAPHALEAAGKSDSGHREIGVSQEALGGEEAVRLRQIDGRGPEGLHHHAPQVPAGDAQLGGEILEPGLLERAGLDAFQRVVRQALGRVDGRLSRRSLRSAKEAGRKPSRSAAAAVE